LARYGDGRRILGHESAGPIRLPVDATKGSAMTPHPHRAVGASARRHATWVAVVAVALGAGLSGCSIVRAVKHVTGVVETNRGIINTFTAKLKAGEATTFQATYMTTGNSPTTIVYAVQPPKGLAFQSLPAHRSDSNGGDLSFIVNSSGEYSCDRPTASARWSCDKLDPATAAVKKNSSASTHHRTGSPS
jgi:hypothetical protein